MWKTDLFNRAAMFVASLNPDAGLLCSIGEEGVDAGGAAAEPDLRSELSDAFDAFDAGGGGVAEIPATLAPKAAKPDDFAVPGETAAQAAARTRDQQGRFAKPGEAGQTVQQKSEPNAPQAPVTPQGQVPATSGPPPAWSAPAKAKFAGLDPIIQQEVLKREGEIATGKLEWEQKAERFNRLDAILAPRSERFRLAGLDEVGAVNALFAAQDMLERTPVDALLYLGRQRGVNWQMLFQRLQGDQGQPQQPQVPPGMEPVLRQLNSLTNWATQQQQSSAEAVRNGLNQQITTFASDPKNIYFANVKERMGRLIRAGEAENLAEAYDKACWADPQIRPLMLQQTEQQRQADARAAAGAKVVQARNASGSVTGSPTPGSSPVGGGPAPTLRDELSQVWDAVA